ncbi:hypothetical protein K1719_031534 [Acacia pycnantha]|nr:hypothetical protein K1719_031534 [Acacia pycnantha]
MIHPIPFESSPKNDPPPHPSEDQLVKRAKLVEASSQDTVMDAGHSQEIASAETHVSATMTTEYVPETQLLTDPPPAQDVPMTDSNTDSSIKIPSFKDKLQNSDSKNLNEEDDDLILEKGEFPLASTEISQLSTLLTMSSTPSTKRWAWQWWSNCLNALLIGPWMIYGHYLTVQPWTPSFKPQDHVINQVMGWIRLPKLPARYYHKSIICSIGSVFEDVIKVDYNTNSGDRGKFARIAVSLDLTKPLTSKIMVDGELIYMEYEGLPTICFNCGRYSHLQGACPALRASSSNDQPEATLAPEPNVPSPDLQAREATQFGAWMQVQRCRRTTVRGDRSN